MPTSGAQDHLFIGGAFWLNREIIALCKKSAANGADLIILFHDLIPLSTPSFTGHDFIAEYRGGAAPAGAFRRHDRTEPRRAEAGAAADRRDAPGGPARRVLPLADEYPGSRRGETPGGALAAARNARGRRIRALRRHHRNSQEPSFAAPGLGRAWRRERRGLPQPCHRGPARLEGRSDARRTRRAEPGRLRRLHRGADRRRTALALRRLPLHGVSRAFSKGGGCRSARASGSESPAPPRTRLPSRPSPAISAPSSRPITPRT